jgi:hypothetical protein
MGFFGLKKKVLLSLFLLLSDAGVARLLAEIGRESAPLKGDI